MLWSFNKRPEYLLALDRVREWTRARFKLPEDAAILVSEVSCTVPGCPPLHTAIVFWSEDAKRHQLKLFKPVMQVILDDLPPVWMKNALITADGLDCDCC